MATNRKIKIVTHGGKFHTDDVFGVATLFLLLGRDNCELTRSRNQEDCEKGDYVLDTGFKYDPEKNLFDHHQPDGAGKRGNGIPYASFGLIWKHFGEQVTGSNEIAETIDQVLVQPIDAMDNGIDITKNIFEDVDSFRVQDIINLHRPTWKEGSDYDSAFLEAVAWAMWVVRRKIKQISDNGLVVGIVRRAYETAEDKRLIVLEGKENTGRELVVSTLIEYPEPLYAVLYRGDVDAWQVVAINEGKGTYKIRKPLPEEWWGKNNEKFESASGVKDVIFCHRNGFMCVAKSKEGALKLARLALEAN